MMRCRHCFIVAASASMRRTYLENGQSMSYLRACTHAVHQCLHTLETSNSCSGTNNSFLILLGSSNDNCEELLTYIPTEINHFLPSPASLSNHNDILPKRNAWQSLPGSNIALLDGNFCDAIELLSHLLVDNGWMKSNDGVQSRVILFTDVEESITVDVASLPDTIDRLLHINCRLDVIGINFNPSSPIQPKETDDVDGMLFQGNEKDSSMQGCVSDTELKRVVYALKDDRQALIYDIVQKIGGRIVLADSYDQILNCAKSILDENDRSQPKEAIEISDDAICTVKPTLQPDGTTGFCKMQCGFYGAQVYEGFCSQCWTTSKKRLRSSPDSTGIDVPIPKRQPISIYDRMGPSKRLIWDGRDKRETFEQWLEICKPSRISNPPCAWICVENNVPGSPGYGHFPPHFDGSAYSATLNQLRTKNRQQGVATAEECKVCTDALLNIAAAQNHLSGKWILYPNKDSVDQLWEKIATATYQGRLGCSAKVSPCAGAPSNSILCCVYVNDFRNRQEIQRVLRDIQSLGIPTKWGFKPDVFTDLGIYQGNPWKLSPVIYRPAQVEKWNLSSKGCQISGKGVSGKSITGRTILHSEYGGLGGKSETPSSHQPRLVSMVSFNVAEFKPSKVAPEGWDPMPDFKAELVRLKPDVICLQEVPPGRESFLQDAGYMCVGMSSSHCANVVLLVKGEWTRLITVIYKTNVAPAVLVKIMLDSEPIVLGSCHLFPFGEGAAKRFNQIQEILKMIGEDQPLILGGDFNMRLKEDISFEQLGLRDAWKETGAEQNERNTWDSYSNRYHGPESYKFACRFDRIYFKGNHIQAKEFQLMANTPLKNEKHYLSDHFGMFVKFALTDANVEGPDQN